MQKPTEKPIKFIRNVATKGKSYPITHIEAVVDSSGKTLPDILEETIPAINTESGVLSYTDAQGNTKYIAASDSTTGINSNLQEITWQELKYLRDNGQLIAGSLYRITDYQCTTTQANTRSAGHQFDIVLLALSANKLAEEGWAMMNESNIYDVTFSDGVTKRCWMYITDDNECNLVDIQTKLGIGEIIIDEELTTIDENNHTITIENVYSSDGLTEENLTYNYFQNSNLSAWKVWYCLDNDTDRFAWASDTSYITSDEDDWIRNEPDDEISNNIKYYAWYTQAYDRDVYTLNDKPTIGDNLYRKVNNQIVVDDINVERAVLVGTGVIYRLIDEWGNDCPYDFKNIQYVRPMTDGQYDPEGEDTWCYTFSLIGEDAFMDASIISYAWNNYISAFIDVDEIRGLSNSVFVGDDVKYNNRLYECKGITLNNPYNVSLYDVYDKTPDEVESNSIYIGDKKVLTEE